MIYRDATSVRCFIRESSCFVKVVDLFDNIYQGAGAVHATLKRTTTLLLFDEKPLEECIEFVHVLTLDDSGYVCRNCQRSSQDQAVHL